MKQQSETRLYIREKLCYNAKYPEKTGGAKASTHRPPSSSGLGYMVLSHGTGVRIPLGVPMQKDSA